VVSIRTTSSFKNSTFHPQSSYGSLNKQLLSPYRHYPLVFITAGVTARYELMIKYNSGWFCSSWSSSNFRCQCKKTKPGGRSRWFLSQHRKCWPASKDIPFERLSAFPCFNSVLTGLSKTDIIPKAAKGTSPLNKAPPNKFTSQSLFRRQCILPETSGFQIFKNMEPF
jgi:hypothetical protein